MLQKNTSRSAYGKYIRNHAKGRILPIYFTIVVEFSTYYPNKSFSFALGRFHSTDL